MKKTVRIVVAIALVAVMCAALVACAPKSIDAAKKKLEKKGYSVSIGEEGDFGYLMATKDSDTIYAQLCKDTKTAKEEFKAAEETAKLMDGYTVKRIGKWVVMGTKQAIKDFQG